MDTLYGCAISHRLRDSTGSCETLYRVEVRNLLSLGGRNRSRQDFVRDYVSHVCAIVRQNLAQESASREATPLYQTFDVGLGEYDIFEPEL